MEHYDLTFRFDDMEQNLNKYNGLPIDELAKFLKALAQAVKDTKSENLVLSEIKGNCYAPVISSKSYTQYEQMKAIHSKIATRDLIGLSKEEIDYAKILNGLLSRGYQLNIYNNEKDYYRTIEKIDEPTSFAYYYQTESLRGLLTRIGSSNLNSKTTIEISSFSGPILINVEQEQALKDHYKKNLLQFYVTQKVEHGTRKIEYSELDDFVVLRTSSNYQGFVNGLDTIREKFGTYFSTFNGEGYE